MKSKNIQKALKSIIIFEGIALTTFIPSVSKVVSVANNSAQLFFANVSSTTANMYNVAIATPFGFSNLWFIALLFVAIGIPILDILLRGDDRYDS